MIVTMTLELDYLNALSTLQAEAGVIAFHTDTVFGLGCFIDHPKAVERIYTLKGRDETKPLILLGYEQQAFVPYVADLPSKALDLMEAHWPGALTIVLEKSERVPKSLTRGLETIGLRVAKSDVFREFLKLVPGGLIATTSANPSGHEPALSAKTVHTYFGDNIPNIIDDPAIPCLGSASTVVGINSNNELTIFRQGDVVIN